MQDHSLDIDAIAQAYMGGTSLNSLCKQNDISAHRLTTLLRKRGCVMRSYAEAQKVRGCFTEEQRAQRREARGVDTRAICQDYLNGASMDALRRKYGVGVDSIAEIFRQAGVRTHRRVELRGMGDAPVGG